MSEILRRNISRVRNGIQVDGRTQTLGAETITVLFQNEAGDVLFAYGATLPTDATAGYAKGCIFFDTSGGVGTTVYANDGSNTSCDFNANLGGTGDVTSVTAGNGLIGGGASGALTVDVVGGTGITANANDVAIAAGYLPSHVVKYAGKFTTAGGDANEQASVSGVLGTDIVVATLEVDGTNNVTLKTAKAGTNVIDFVMSADPAADAIICYTVFRAVA